MSLLMPDSGLLFWMVVIFAVVLFVLAKWGFPVITSMVDKRKSYIDRSLRLAREADEKMAGLAAEQARIIAEARAEQNRILKVRTRRGMKPQNSLRKPGHRSRPKRKVP